jgi:ubiquinone biosynthesis protein
MWLETLGAAQDMGRLHDIASILIRYGFGDVVQRLGMSKALERAGRLLHMNQIEELVQLTAAVRMRRALEELGPTFVKLGQLLATRVDLFTPEWINEFEKLQDHASHVLYSEIHAQLQEDLGQEPEVIFAEFNQTALAAGSIAQVHRARLHEGNEVVVKIRRPGIQSIVDADMRLLQRLAKMVEAESPEWRRFQPLEILRQFKASLSRELDLAIECHNAERIKEVFIAHPEICIPKVYWQFTSERVNVQDFIVGIAAHDLVAIDEAGLDRKKLARIGAYAALKMVLEDGFFHADPHAGNLFYLPHNHVALIDYGMVGHLSEKRRYQLIDLLQGLVHREAEQVMDILLEWTDNSDLDDDKLALDVDNFLNQYHGVPLKRLNLTAMLNDVTVILRDNQLNLPPDLAMVIKVFVVLESVGRNLNPDFDMASEAAPMLRRLLVARYHPLAIAKRGHRAISGSIGILASLPGSLREILRHARSGKIKVSIDLERLKHLGDQLDHSANRLTIGVVIAALIIGSSIVMTVKGGPTLLGLPVFGLLGFLTAVFGSMWLLYSIWRSGGGR